MATKVVKEYLNELYYCLRINKYVFKMYIFIVFIYLLTLFVAIYYVMRVR